MVFTFARRISANIQRRIQRALLVEPEKTPQRIAVAMASIVLLSIIFNRRQPWICIVNAMPKKNLNVWNYSEIFRKFIEIRILRQQAKICDRGRFL
ncbi:unnamed protein product [Adineta ricciae]|uniref:Uncharacterized protein n=1 Tax=Adineta ricciae TaxID=249248 RepID=A0A815B9D9_ADIRI|nr:unnamed protein product [Adineta ricciae]